MKPHRTFHRGTEALSQAAGRRWAFHKTESSVSIWELSRPVIGFGTRRMIDDASVRRPLVHPCPLRPSQPVRGPFSHCHPHFRLFGGVIKSACHSVEDWGGLWIRLNLRREKVSLFRCADRLFCIGSRFSWFLLMLGDGGFVFCGLFRLVFGILLNVWWCFMIFF